MRLIDFTTQLLLTLAFPSISFANAFTAAYQQGNHDKPYAQSNNRLLKFPKIERLKFFDGFAQQDTFIPAKHNHGN